MPPEPCFADLAGRFISKLGGIAGMPEQGDHDPGKRLNVSRRRKEAGLAMRDELHNPRATRGRHGQAVSHPLQHGETEGLKPAWANLHGSASIQAPEL